MRIIFCVLAAAQLLIMYNRKQGEKREKRNNDLKPLEEAQNKRLRLRGCQGSDWIYWHNTGEGGELSSMAYIRCLGNKKIYLKLLSDKESGVNLNRDYNINGTKVAFSHHFFV